MTQLIIWLIDIYGIQYPIISTHSVLIERSIERTKLFNYNFVLGDNIFKRKLNKDLADI